VRSCASTVEAGELESWEFRETEDSEGDSRLVFLLCWGRGAAFVAFAGGGRVFAFPRTLPRPRVLPEDMFSGVVVYIIH
jgi:hypothetical protein